MCKVVWDDILVFRVRHSFIRGCKFWMKGICIIIVTVVVLFTSISMSYGTYLKRFYWLMSQFTRNSKTSFSLINEYWINWHLFHTYDNLTYINKYKCPKSSSSFFIFFFFIWNLNYKIVLVLGGTMYLYTSN